MARKILIWAVAVLLIALVIVALMGGIQVIGPIVMLGLLLAALVFERFHYARARDTPPAARFKPNGERFIDPETGSPVTVYSDPRTGERRYINDTMINNGSDQA